MRRALFQLFWMAVILPTTLGAQEVVGATDRPWWLEALIFVVSLPYTLYRVFVDGERLHLLPAPLIALWLMLSSFREWRRQRYWTPRSIHLAAGLALATIILINVDWVMSGGEMWTQRYVVIAVFGLFPYLAYLLFRGPHVLGRRRAPAVRARGDAADDVEWDPGAPGPVRTPPERSGGRGVFGTALRLTALAGVGVVGLLIVAGGGGGGGSIDRPEFGALRAPEATRPLARGVAKGDPEAPFTIVEFGDYQCPGCGKFARGHASRIDSAFVETGRAQFVFFDLPLTELHANAFLAARAARCAEDQQGFWAYQDRLFQNQEEWSPMERPHDAFEAYAGAAGLDRDVFRSCLDSDRHADVVRANGALAAELGIHSTPTVVILTDGRAPQELRRDTFRSITETIAELEGGPPAPARESTPGVAPGA